MTTHPAGQAARPALPALVEPGADLTAGEAERYSRQILLPEIGPEGQRRLKNASVLVVGAGGLGSPVLLYLAAAGVGTLGIIDDDVVELSNLHRQVVHGVGDLGRSKSASARDAIAALNPLVRVTLHDTRLDEANALALLAPYDLVVDGTDNFATRYLINDAAAILGKPCVWGAIHRFDGQVSVFWERHGPTYRDLYPEAPAAGSVPSCAEGGVIGVLCATIGALMAAEAVKLITGIGRTLLGRVLVFDALAASWRELAVVKDPAGPPITALVDYERLCGVAPRGERADPITVRELAGMLATRDAGAGDFDLIDVREPEEHELGSIPGSRLIPQHRIFSGQALPELPRDRDIVLYCKAGPRSTAVLAELRRAGYARANYVRGGMLAWANEIEPGPGPGQTLG